MTNEFALFSLTFNRRTKEYECVLSFHEHPVLTRTNGYCTGRSPSDYYRTIGMLLSGSAHFGPKEPAKRAALMNGLLDAVGSLRRSDSKTPTISF